MTEATKQLHIHFYYMHASLVDVWKTEIDY